MEAWNVWWVGLCAAAVLNAALWVLSFRAFRRKSLPAEILESRKALLLLSLVYAAGCAFRSLLPMIDVERYCLHDPWIARIFVGRSVATIAELAFAAQWAILMKEAGAVRAARAVLPLIAAAEVLSWLAVLTRNELFHAAENTVWPLTAILAVAFLATRWPFEGERGRMVILGAVGSAAAYVAFMAAYVVPMYLARWQPGAEHLSLGAGLAEVLRPCTVVRDWSLWWQDAAWLTPYFTICVWMSVALAHAPDLRNRADASKPDRQGSGPPLRRVA